MNRKFTKAMICAVASALLLTYNGFSAEAAYSIKGNLPAAGLGLTFGEGASVSQIRDDVKGKTEHTTAQTETAAETESIRETESARETESVRETESIRETESTGTTESTESRSAAETTAPGTTETAQETESGTLSETQETESEEPTIVEAVEPVLKEAETKISEEDLAEEEAKETLIIAQVNDYVNIRSIPSTDGEIVGKLYNNSVGTLIEEEDGWFQMKSGNVEGYVKAEYFETGDEAKRIADEVGNKIATVNTETLRVREGASLDSCVLGLVPGGEELTVLEEENGFVKVSIEEGDGWVSMDYVVVEVEYVTAESVEEERARLEKEEQAKAEARRAAEAAEAKLREQERAREEERLALEQQQAAGQSAEAQPEEETPAPVISSGSGLGSSVANFAVQFVGNPYVYGGTSLTNGADCSGFVMSVYKNFGVSLPHSSSADRHVGYNVGSLTNAQPGDLVCYSGHVAIYIGNGQIVHASTERTGIKISNANYRKVLAVRRIF